MQRAGIRKVVLWIVSAAIATLMFVSYSGARGFDLLIAKRSTKA